MPELAPLKFKIYRRRGAGGTMTWFGRIELPIGAMALSPGERVAASRTAKPRALPGGVTTRTHRAVSVLPVEAPGKDKTTAISNAAMLAAKVAENPFMQAIMPPGTSNALKATQLAAKYGPTVVKNLTGGGAERVASFFKSLF